jgi:hypothetical protein
MLTGQAPQGIANWSRRKVHQARFILIIPRWSRVDIHISAELTGHPRLFLMTSHRDGRDRIDDGVP